MKVSIRQELEWIFEESRPWYERNDEEISCVVEKNGSMNTVIATTMGGSERSQKGEEKVGRIVKVKDKPS